MGDIYFLELGGNPILQELKARNLLVNIEAREGNHLILELTEHRREPGYTGGVMDTIFY